MATRGRFVVAVDGGGGKTDALAVSLTGRILHRASARGASPHLEGLRAAVTTIDKLVRAVSDGQRPRVVSLFLSGVDLPSEEDQFREAIAGLWWGPSASVENDVYALLRSGTDSPDAIAVVCGTGINAVGIRRDGARVRFPSLGHLSGDWGGGAGLGAEALWHAARAVDGRGPGTMLTDRICDALGAAGIEELIEDLHLGRRPRAELTGLPPVVFDAADAGDAIAGALIDRQADEVIAYVSAVASRLGLADAPVVLGGGILRAGHDRLDRRIAAGVAEVSPGLRLVVPSAPPVAGAVLSALERGGASKTAIARAGGLFAHA